MNENISQKNDSLIIDDKNTVKSLAKGLRILEVFSATEPELTMAEIARRSGVDNATAFRFLGTLVSAGYVRRVSDTRLFRLTTKILDLGFSAIAHADLRTCARPILRDLVGEVNEAASVGVLEGWEVMYTERMQAGLTRLGVDIRIGSRVPAYSTAIGHAILAWLPRESQEKILASHPRPALTSTTLTKVEDILQRLAEVRERGYAISDQENVSGLFIVAAPVLDADEVPVAGLSVAAPAMRTTLSEFETLAAGPVQAAAAELSKSLQASGCFVTATNSRTA